ncbi:hypothetical protein PTKIN_Ptkin09bG0252900 [Pterospermum kingtungense]
MLVHLPILKYWTSFYALEGLLIKDPTRVIAFIVPSEYKVYDYLVETAACHQNKNQINEFLERCKNYKLAKAEVLNI